MKSVFLIVLFVFISLSNLDAFPKFKYSPKDDLTQLFPEQQSVQLGLIKSEAIVTSNITISIDEQTSQIIFKNRWPEGQLTAYVNKNLKLIKSIRDHFTNDQTVKASFGNKIVDLPYNKRVIEVNKKKRRLQVSFFMDNKKLTDYELKMPNHSMDMDLIGLYFQGLLHKKAGKSYNSEITVTDMRRSLNVDILFETTTDFHNTSPEYQFPKALEAISKLKEPLDVFIVKPTGFAAMFYPHKFYLFFSQKPPYSLVAWWGGAPKDVMFFVSMERLK